MGQNGKNVRKFIVPRWMRNASDFPDALFIIFFDGRFLWLPSRLLHNSLSPSNRKSNILCISSCSCWRRSCKLLSGTLLILRILLTVICLPMNGTALKMIAPIIESEESVRYKKIHQFLGKSSNDFLMFVFAPKSRRLKKPLMTCWGCFLFLTLDKLLNPQASQKKIV